MTHEREAWLANRAMTWGSSDIAQLMLAYGLAPVDAKVAAWMRDGAAYYQRLHIPKLIAWKSGLMPEPSRDTAIKDEGNRLEQRVLSRWQFTQAHEHVDPRTVQHATRLPQRILPLVDRRCPAIAVSPDAWAYGHLEGEGARARRDFVILEVKTTRDDLDAAPWGYVQQLGSQMDAMSADRGMLLVGVRWLRDDLPDEERYTAPITFAVPRDADETARRYEVATEALELVGQLGAVAPDVSTVGMDAAEVRRSLKSRKTAALRCRDLWDASRARMAHLRDARAVAIGDACEAIDGIDEILARQSA